jgi:hypothetical protein|tara:strand:+ start:58 stop:207 length:150 start_codon:yes stop_codon:yes gene_type:complete
MLNWIKKLLGFKKELSVSSIVKKVIKSGHCNNHPKYKHRCPDCIGAVNG